MFRVNYGNAGAIIHNDIITIKDKRWRVSSIDPSIDNKIIVQKGLNKNNNFGFSYYERLLL